MRSCGFNICMTTKSDIEQLFQSNYRAMLTLAIRLLHDPETARDIVHDVFESLLSAAMSGFLFRELRHSRRAIVSSL